VDLVDFLTDNLLKFIEILRTAGIRVSISESIDTVEALKHVNIMSKSQVKTAMAACLAKSEEERRIFSEAFDEYFVPYDIRAEHISKKTREIELKKQEILNEVSQLNFQGEQIELPDELKEVYSDLLEEEKRSIQQFLEKTSTGKNVSSDRHKDIVEEMIKGRLRKMQGGAPTPSEGVLQQVASEAGIIAGEVIDQVKKENSLLYKNIGDISDKDIPAVIRLIKVIVSRINRNITRRFRNSSKKSRLDLKKTIRSNLNTGGALFTLRYRSRRPRKNKMVMLCDVSASMYRFSGFVMQFIAGIHSNFSSTDSYIFSDDIEHINIRGFLNAADIEQRIRNSPVWRRGTDISRALEVLLNKRHSLINSSTILLIVSDAKTINSDEALGNIKAIKGKVKRILWLNPIPEKDWDKIKNIQEFRKYCDMLDCSTLEKLAKVCINI
jgi:uncharacterized protein with von Willebrand factor type A (vWA) domain